MANLNIVMVAIIFKPSSIAAVWVSARLCVIWTLGLLDMLTRAQCCRVDDQRGLLTKEQLEVPLFLQLPADQGKEPRSEESSTSASSTAHPDKVTESSQPLSSAESEHKDLRETSVWNNLCVGVGGVLGKKKKCKEYSQHFFFVSHFSVTVDK